MRPIRFLLPLLLLSALSIAVGYLGALVAGQVGAAIGLAMAVILSTLFVARNVGRD